jgi:hypothetical protein
VARSAPLGQGEDIVIAVAGQGGIPATATGIVMNVTVTAGTGHSFLTAYPNGSTRLSVSSINWRPGQTVANLVVGSVGTAGSVRLYNEVGAVHVIVDVIGWFEPDVGAGYVALDPPSRTLDTRTGNGGRTTPVGNGATHNLELANLYGVPSDAAAVMLSVIAVAPTSTGFLTVYPTGQPRPGSSNLNFDQNDTVPNAVIAGVGAGGNVALYNFGGSTHYVADLAGYFVDLSERGPPAPTPVSVPLGNMSFSDMAVDDAREHIYLSSPAAHKVVVYRFDGALVGEIPNIQGAAGMTIVGSTLYVVSVGAIKRINLVSRADEGTVATGLGAADRLAYAGGKLWIGVGSGGWTTLTSVALDGTVTPSTVTLYSPDFTTSPAQPGTLYAAERGLSPASVQRINVAGATPVSVSQILIESANVRDVVVSPDATRIIPAAGAPYEFRELVASTLQPSGVVYPGEPYPNSVAVSPGRGGLLATGLFIGTPGVKVHKMGNPVPIFTTSPGDAIPDGLGLSEDGSKLFTVTEVGSNRTLGIWPLPPDPPG